MKRSDRYWLAMVALLVLVVALMLAALDWPW